MNAYVLVGRILIVIGLSLAALGLLLTLTKGSIPIGHLPGDIVIKRDNFSFYFPITTSILLSLLLSLIIWLVYRFLR